MLLNELQAANDLYGEITDSLEAWREYKGERIQIRESTVDHVKDEHLDVTNVERVDTVIEGTVEKVMATPRGFVLTDVKKYVDQNPRMKGPNWELPDEAKEITERKFVSFNSIEEIDFIDSDN